MLDLVFVREHSLRVKMDSMTYNEALKNLRDMNIPAQTLVTALLIVAASVPEALERLVGGKPGIYVRGWLGACLLAKRIVASLGFDQKAILKIDELPECKGTSY